MGRTKGPNTTKDEIFRVASRMFLEVGYSGTYPRMIADELNIRPSNITYYFPTKEHLLLAVVEILCDFQYMMLEAEENIGSGSVAAICLETMSVAVACDESDTARDLFINVFQGELCRNYLCNNHVERAKRIFAKECESWTDEQFQQAELLVMGLQYAAIIPTDANISLKMRLEGALNQILSVYQVPEEERQKEIATVLAKDCRGISKRILGAFIDFVKERSRKSTNQ